MRFPLTPLVISAAGAASLGLVEGHVPLLLLGWAVGFIGALTSTSIGVREHYEQDHRP